MVSRKRSNGRARRAARVNNDNGRPQDTNTTTLTQQHLISKLNELSVAPSCNHLKLQPTQTSLAFVKAYDDTLIILLNTIVIASRGSRERSRTLCH